MTSPTVVKCGPALVAQIVSSYEICGLATWAIADQLDVEGGARTVEEVLGLHSELYREHTKFTQISNPLDPAPKLNRQTSEADAEYEELKRQYKILSQSAPESAVREKALRWLLDEARGRNDVALGHLALKKQEVSTRSGQEERLAKFNALIKQAFHSGTPTEAIEIEGGTPAPKLLASGE